MRVALRSCALLLAAAMAAGSADSDADALFRKARARVLDNAHRLPRYTCVETIYRAQYLPPRGAPAACRRTGPQGGLAVRDRLRLDVAVVDGDEIFSWAGAGKFETHDVAKIVGRGASGSGEFGSFLASVFGSAPDAIGYLGPRGNLALFEFNVPLARSNYTYHSDTGPAKKIGYRGTFSVTPSDGDLQQLVVETDEFDSGDRACGIEHVMNYQRVRIGSGDFLLPEASTMKALYRNGGESVNETRYSNCREYTGESTIRFDAADPPAPTEGAGDSQANIRPLSPNVHLQIALASPIDTELAAAGDEVAGVAAFGNENDRVHGRILRLVQFMTPLPHWIMAIRFDTIERGGVIQPLALRPIGGNPGSPFPELPADAGVFTFDGRGKLVLDQRFQSFWEIR